MLSLGMVNSDDRPILFASRFVTRADGSLVAYGNLTRLSEVEHI